MDKFDKLIKDAVESYEAPYDAQVWANVSNQLGHSKGGAMKWIVGSAAAVVLISGSIYLLNDTDTVTDTPLTQTTTEQQLPVQTADNTNAEDLTSTSNDLADQNQSATDIDNGSHTSTPFLPISDPGHPGTMGEIGNSDITVNNGQSGNENSNSGQVTGNENNSNGQTIEPIADNSAARFSAKFDSEIAMACMNTEFVFTPEDINQSALYVWDFGDGSYSSSKLGVHTFKRSGTFTVSLSLKDSKTNKTLSKSSMEIVVNPIPEVDFAYEKNNEMIPTVTFINLTDNVASWQWDIKGQRTSTENQFEYTFRKKGIYTVELSATNDFNCSASVQKPIEVKSDYNLLAPTAFTPNGDNKNDYFIPEALRLMDVNFTMVIYDKAGTMLYQTNSVNQPWDGTNMNDNSMADDGAYVWQVQFKNANGETEYYEGQVIITR